MALGRRCFGTKFATIACLEGISKARRILVANDVTMMCHGAISSNVMRIPVAKAMVANKTLVTIINLVLFTRSAITPPHIVRSRVGPRLEAVTSPNIVGESDNSFISQRRPAIKVHIPIFDVAPPIQKKR